MDFRSKPRRRNIRLFPAARVDRQVADTPENFILHLDVKVLAGLRCTVCFRY